MTNNTSIPDVSKIANGELRRIILAMKTEIENLRGLGRTDTRAVTMADLITTGLIKDNGTNITAGAVLVAGSDTGPATPARPENFKVTSDNLTLATASWAEPLSKNHTHTEIWTGIVNSVESATRTLTATNSTITFNPPTELGGPLYFWARHVNNDGTPSSYHATNGVAMATNGEVDERILRVMFDASDGLAIGTHSLPGKLPANATVTRTRYKVTTPFANAPAPAPIAQVGLSIETDDSYGLVANSGITSAPWIAGWERRHSKRYCWYILG
jgi:hypothetical protein